MLVKPTRGAVLDKSHPLARGLVACWLFNEATGGIVSDVSGNHYDGILNGDIVWAPGRFGSCLDYQDLVDNYVQLSGMPTLSARTYACWLYPRSGGGTYMMIWRENNSWTAIVPSRSIRTWTGGAGSIPAFDAWYHLVIVYDGTYKSTYLDGKLIYGPTSASINDAYLDVIGNHHASDPYSFYGLIDHAMVYDRALSDSEIAWLYREPFAMISIPSPPLVVISAGGIINAEGQIDGTSSASSTATVDWVVEASVSGTSSVTPDATVEWSAAVDVDAASTVTPDAVVDWGAVVDIDATSTVSPDAVVEWGAATQVDGESGLTVGAVVDWAAETTIGATSSVTPGATVDWSAATQIDATSGLTGTASIGEVFVEGTIDATSSVTVGAIVDWAAETSIAAAATVAADLTGLFLLEVSIAAASSLTGTAQTGLLHSASGSISAVASIIGTLRNTRDANWTVDTSTTSITWQNVSEDNDITWTLE